MSPNEVISKFVSFELMVKDSKYIRNKDHGATSTLEPQPIAFKATKEKEETTPNKGLQINTSKLDKEEMGPIIKCFRRSSSNGRRRSTNPIPRGFVIDVVSLVII